jgi:indoleacetamide hydrolase
MTCSERVQWSELSLRDATARLRDGDISAEGYVQALLDVCDAKAPLNAFIALDRARVLSEARAADLMRRRGYLLGPLHGVPLAIKDVFDVTGSPTTAGTPALRDHLPRRTAPLVQTLFDAGASMLGKTNMHELAFGITSANDFTGAVRNPRDPTRSPGGSSGGTAAAVTAGMAPAGLGSDTSGSIRIPAAHCGIVGFRPSTGRYAGDGMVPMSHTRDAPGLMARHVEDIAFIDRIIARGYPLPQADLKGLRIGLPRDYFFAALDDRIAAAVETELDRLAALGVVFVEATPPDFAKAREVTGPIMAWEMPRDVASYLVTAGSQLTFADVVATTVSPYVKSELEGLLAASPKLDARYWRAVSEVLPRHRAAYEAYLHDNDLQAIAFPTTPLPPPPLGENNSVQVNGEPVSIWCNLRNSVPATLLGAPALSVPIATTDEGWPVGLEFDGWPGRDRELLALGVAWERCSAPS